MQNAISLNEWLQVIGEEYLSTFIRDGGASVKFAVTPEDLKEELYAKAMAGCRELDYLFVRLDAATARAHMPQDFFFGLARQVDWRFLARRMILTLAAEQGYRIDGIEPGAPGNVFNAIADVNDLEPQFVLGGIRPKVQNSVFRNMKMAKDFRVCMSHLCREETCRD